MTDLAQQMEVLARRLDALEVENAELRGQLGDADSSQSADEPIESRRFGRRNLLRLGGAAAAVGAGSVLLRPGVAGATTGAMQFGAANNAVGDETTLISSNGVSTLALTNSLSGAAVRATNSNSGAAVSAHTSNASNTTTAFTVTDDGQGGAIFAEATNSATLSPAIFGLISADTATVPVVELEHDGTGPGLFSHLDNPANTQSALRGTTAGKGVGLDASSTGGIGAKFTGHRAQVQLVPTTAASHPATGAPGTLYVDKSKRLWYCKGSTTWKQLA